MCYQRPGQSISLNVQWRMWISTGDTDDKRGLRHFTYLRSTFSAGEAPGHLIASEDRQEGVGPGRAKVFRP